MSDDNVKIATQYAQTNMAMATRCGRSAATLAAASAVVVAAARAAVVIVDVSCEEAAVLIQVK